MQAHDGTWIPRRESHAILNRDEMSIIAGWLIDHRGAPWSQVDPRLRNMQPTLSRLRKKSSPAVGSGFFWEMTTLLANRGEVALVQRLYAAVLCPKGRQIHRNYVHWLSRAIRRYPVGMKGAPRFQETEGGPEPISEDARVSRARSVPWWQTWPSDIAELDAVHVLRWHARHGVIARLREDKECSERLAKFEEWIKSRDFESRRWELALWRIAEPFAECADSGFVERNLAELSPAEKRRFVAASIERETILMDRETGFRRIQEVTKVALPYVHRPRKRVRKGRS